jgi:methylglyoxal synthase
MVNRRPSLAPTNFDVSLASEIDATGDYFAQPINSKFKPGEMRQLALVAHNHMKPAMKEFIETYSEVLKKFRITGTNTTMRMCKSLWGEDDPEIEYGMACTSGPLGGDAQVAALMCLEDLGGLIFFIDPLSAHPHQADIDSLVRLCNCGNVIVCCNPTSAMSMMHTFKCALEKGSRGMIPSFFETLESPSVEQYKLAQEAALQSVIAKAPAPQDNTAILEALSEDSDDDSDDEPLPVRRANRSSTLIPLAAVNEDKRTERRKSTKGMMKGLGKSVKQFMKLDSDLY